MSKKVRHVLGISGGKDSAALAIYMKDHYPTLDMEYYTCDTGKELKETYQLIDSLEVYLGKKIMRLRGGENSNLDPFDHHLEMLGGFLPSSNRRWCTKKLKLDPFEKFVGDDPVISYVGIRGDEDREGYISKKTTIQSIFPFRQNIWSEDVISKVLSNATIPYLLENLAHMPFSLRAERFAEVLAQPLSFSLTQSQKLKLLLDADTKLFNRLTFQYLTTTDYPLSSEAEFGLVENDEILVRDDIFKLLEVSGVGVPAYYKKIDFSIDDLKSHYSRSRSGCYFCFFQQKIEWVWLHEQHPELYTKAMEYEKDGFSWSQEETLEELIRPDRVKAIKEEFIRRTERITEKHRSPYLLDILGAEEEGCAACFI